MVIAGPDLLVPILNDRLTTLGDNIFDQEILFGPHYAFNPASAPRAPAPVPVAAPALALAHT